MCFMRMSVVLDEPEVRQYRSSQMFLPKFSKADASEDTVEGICLPIFFVIGH